MAISAIIGLRTLAEFSPSPPHIDFYSARISFSFPQESPPWNPLIGVNWGSLFTKGYSGWFLISEHAKRFLEQGYESLVRDAVNWCRGGISKSYTTSSINDLSSTPCPLPYLLSSKFSNYPTKHSAHRLCPHLWQIPFVRNLVLSLQPQHSWSPGSSRTL